MTGASEAEQRRLIQKWRREAGNADTNDVERARLNCAYELEQSMDRDVNVEQPDEWEEREKPFLDSC
jgi:hypothetical protein